jgi:purine-cytosine permease-like protein
MEEKKRFFSLKERDTWPVSKYKLHGAKHFIGFFSAAQISATEFVIGVTFVNLGVSFFDILVGLLIGNLLAVLSWVLITTPISYNSKLTVYMYLKKIGGPGISIIFNCISMILFAILSGAMLTVTASALRAYLNIPVQLLWYPQNFSFVLLIIIFGCICVFIAVFGFTAVSRFSTVCSPWMILMFIVGALITLPYLAYQSYGSTIVDSFSSFSVIANKLIWTGLNSKGEPGAGILTVIGFAWACNTTNHFGLIDSGVLRFAKKKSYGFLTAFGMFFGHYLAWICAGIMGAAAAMMMNTTLPHLDSGDVGIMAIGIVGTLTVLLAGWTSSTANLYLSSLAALAIFHKYPRKTVTLVVGFLTVVIACFPFVFTLMFQMMTYAGLVIVPAGGIVFAEYFLFPKLKLTRFWAYYRGLRFNWPAVAAWAVAIVFALVVNYYQIVLYYYIFLPTWIIAIVLYILLASFAGAKGNYENEIAIDIENQEEVAEIQRNEFLSEKDKLIADKESLNNKNRDILDLIMRIISWGSLFVILIYALIIFIAPDSYTAYMAKLSTFKNTALCLSVIYFITGTIGLEIRERKKEKNDIVNSD